MNFKDWYNSTLASEHTPDKLYGAEHGWDACKNEILKILFKHTNGVAQQLGEYLPSDTVEKIKDL